MEKSIFFQYAAGAVHQAKFDTCLLTKFETTTWWKKSGGLAKQMSFLESCCGEDEKSKDDEKNEKIDTFLRI